jgi:hypothetical protein
MVNLLHTVSTFLGVKAALLEDMVVHLENRGRTLGSLQITEDIVQARRAAANASLCLA